MENLLKFTRISQRVLLNFRIANESDVKILKYGRLRSWRHADPSASRRFSFPGSLIHTHTTPPGTMHAVVLAGVLFALVGARKPIVREQVRGRFRLAATAS